MIKTRLASALLLVSVCFCLQAHTQSKPEIAHETLDGVVAIVNDGIITKSELAKQVKLIGRQIQQNNTPLPEYAVLEKQVLEHLILNEIQRQLAKKTGIQISEIEVDHAIENIAKQNNFSITQLRQALAQENIDFTYYRNNLRQQMEVHQLQQRDVLSQVHVSEQEVSQYLQSPNGLGGMITEYRVSHILLPLQESPTSDEVEATMQKANHIAEQLRKGQDFTQTAFLESKGELALQGGDLGWRKLPELPTIFEKVVPTLQLNEVPQPIRSNSGFHIIKLVDKRTHTHTESSTEKLLVRHILIKTNANTSEDEAKARINTIRNKLLEGADFGQLAKAHSADLASANRGGSIGWVTQDVLVPEFSQALQPLALNEISAPFATPFGWHIAQVLERTTQTSEESNLRQKAREMLQNRKYEERYQLWSRQIQDEAFIVSFIS